MAKGVKGFQPGNKIGENSKFTSTRQPKKRGRKPSLYRKIKELTKKHVDVELSKEDFYNVLRWVLEQNEETLKPLFVGSDGKPNNETPLWLLSVISAIRNDIRYGKTATIEMIFDRIFGKATQVVESDVQLTSNRVDLSSLTTEELLQLNTLLGKMKCGSEQDFLSKNV